MINGPCHVREYDRAQVPKGRGVTGPGWRLHVEMNFPQHMKPWSSCFPHEFDLIVHMLECLFKYLWSSHILYPPLTWPWKSYVLAFVKFLWHYPIPNHVELFSTGNSIQYIYLNLVQVSNYL